MTFKYGDRVIVHNLHGEPVGQGTIANVNDFREPEAKYAIDADFYKEDFLFVGEKQLTISREEYKND